MNKVLGFAAVLLTAGILSASAQTQMPSGSPAGASTPAGPNSATGVQGMPGSKSGRELADEVLRRRPDVKVLYTSGYSESAIIHNGRLDPGVRLLTKPYRRSDLAQMVRVALGETRSGTPG